MERLDILCKYKELVSDRLVLNGFTTDDIEDIFEYGRDELTVKYLSWNRMQTLDDALWALENVYSNRCDVFAIRLKDTGKCIGCIDIRLDSDNDKASFGYVLNRAYWGSGYMSESLKTILHLAFEKLMVVKVEGRCDRQNIGSGKVMEKSGMKLEGVLAKTVKVKGSYRDMCIYGITREMWLRGKQGNGQ